ncbi:MAG TPA: nucleotidyltransferase family protein [Kiritimatiellia bacterium]|nr:nucleotidyltransferase family protein [Kiritimatiellia bacterium]
MNHLRDILDLLVRAATGQPRPAASWPAAHHPTWPAIEYLAAFHRVVPLIAYHIEEDAIPAPPPAIATAWADTLHRNRLRHLLALNDLADLETALSRAGIPCCPLKGPRLADTLYPSPGLRVSDDLDLLIAPAARDAAFAVLRERGYYTRESSLPLVARYHFHTTWWHRTTGNCVELHTRPADRATLPGPADAPADFVATLRDDPAAMAVYLALHLDKHGWLNRYLPAPANAALTALHPWTDNRLLWLIDLARHLHHHQPDTATLDRTATAWRCRTALHRSLRLAAALHLMPPDAIPAPAPAAPAPWPFRPLLRHLEHDLDSLDPARLATPWWLRPGRLTGFRPVRIATALLMR